MRRATARLELQAKIEINAIFIKSLCSDTYNNFLKAMLMGGGGIWVVIHPLEKVLLASVAFFGRS